MSEHIPTPTRIEAAGNKPKIIEEFFGRVNSGEAIHTRPGEWVRYSTPGDAGAEYVAVCLPVFSPDTVHRDDS